MKLKDILEMPRSREYVFHTDMDIDECAARLKNAVMKQDIFFWDYEISSKVNDKKITVEVKDLFYGIKNSVFWGRMERSKTGTDIFGYFGMDSKMKFFLLLLSAFFLLIFPVYLVLPFILIIILSFVIGFRTAGIEESPAMGYLKTTLLATQISPIPRPLEYTSPRDEDLDENYIFYSRQFRRRK